MPNANQRFDGDRIERLLEAKERRGIEGFFARIVKWGHADREAERRDAEIVQAVMSRLPEGSPEVYRRLALLVFRAWTHPAIRASLRDDPIAFLSTQGIEVPDGTRIEFVTLEQVALPTRGKILIPLPEVHERALTEAHARSAFAHTPWEWMFGLPFDDPSAASSVEERAVDRLAGSGRTSVPNTAIRPNLFDSFPFSSRSALAGIGALAAAFGAIWIAFGDRSGFGEGSALSGAIVNAPGFGLWIGLAAVSTLVVIAAWMASRR